LKIIRKIYQAEELSCSLGFIFFEILERFMQGRLAPPFAPNQPDTGFKSYQRFFQVLKN